MEFSKLAESVFESLTLSISAKAKQLIKEGKSVIAFTAGEPDFDTPDFVKKSAIKAIEEGYTKYTPTVGILELRQAICDKLQRDNGLTYAPDEIIVSTGAKTSIYHVLLAILNPGDEVILGAPYWLTYPEQITIVRGVPVIVDTTDANYKLTKSLLQSALTPKTKAIILNSPNNPTGTMYTAEELKNIADFAIENDLLVVSDEIYEKLSYDKPHVSIASISQEIKSRTIVINGVSKAYSMTGWRIGYAAADKKIIKKMSTMQSHITSNACSISQHAALSALVYGDQFTKDAKAIFSARRLLMLEFFKSLKDVTFPQPDGAFYMFLNVSNYYGTTYKGRKIDGSMTFADCLLDHGVAVIPGLPFGDDNSIRLSYAVSEKDILEGFIRIKDFLSQLSH